MTAEVVPDTARTTWTDARRAARDDGLLAGLRVAQTSLVPGVLPVGPRGHVLVTAELARTATRLGVAPPSDRRRERERVLAEFAPDGRCDDVLVALRVTDLPGTGEWDGTPGWATTLAHVRLGLAERLLDRCLSYLAGRHSGGQRLLDLQLIRGDLGEIAIGLQEIEGLLDTGRQAHAHRRLTGVDRLSLRLLGASGFLADGPGQVAFLSELLVNAYVDLGAR